jgi:hypothetical protein
MKCTHMVVSVPDYDASKLEEAELLKQVIPGLTPVVYCTNVSDARVCRNAFQQSDRRDFKYGIVELKVPFDMP